MFKMDGREAIEISNEITKLGYRCFIDEPSTGSYQIIVDGRKIEV
jgi:hypothetical protein